MQPRRCALALAALLHAASVGCGSPPASLRDAEPRGEHRALEDLCASVLGDPSSPDAARALGELLEAWTRDRRIRPAPPCAGRVEFAPAEVGGFDADYFDALAPAERFVVRDMTRRRRAGAGVALVGVRRNLAREPLEAFYPPEAIARAVTALAERDPSDPGRVRVRLLSSLAHEDARVDAARVPLAADFTAAFAALLGSTEAWSRSRLTSFFAERPPRGTQLYLMEPYDPRKTPVLFVHGIASTPLAWAALTNEIWGNDALRRTHQVWHFLYPTSVPFPWSARLLRERLDALRARLAADGLSESPPLVVVAHSMGGLLAKTLVTDSGEEIWSTVFQRPPDALTGEPADVALVRDILHWKPRPHVGRVIFLAVPHRGSPLASDPAVRFGDSFVETAQDLGALYARIETANPGAIGPLFRDALTRGRMSSIKTLAPNHPILAVLDAKPLAPWVTAHSLMGDRGHSGPREQSDDGVVPWWSSHFPAAASETLVPAGHTLTTHPETIREVLRLLALP